MSEQINRQLVCSALAMALGTRIPDADQLMHHSDRGSQYCSHLFQELLQSHNISCSMSRRGNCYDNAVVESFFATLKKEEVYQQQYNTREEARMRIFEYIEVSYNRQRRHSSLGGMSPVEYEEAA